MLKASRARTGANTRVLIVMRPAIIVEAAACRRRAARILAEQTAQPGRAAGKCGLGSFRRGPALDPVERHQNLAAPGARPATPRLAEDQLDRHGQPALGGLEPRLEPPPTGRTGQAATAATRDVDRPGGAEVPHQ